MFEMKKFCFLLVVIFLLPFAASAQQLVQGNLSFLKGQTFLDCSVDFSQASILGMTEDEIAVQEEDWWKDRHNYVGRFYEGINSKLMKKSLFVGKHENASYRAELVVRQVEKNGNMLSEFVISSTENPEEILCKIVVSATGGRFGSFLNLLGDGMEHTGEILSKYISGQLK